MKKRLATLALAALALTPLARADEALPNEPTTAEDAFRRFALMDAMGQNLKATREKMTEVGLPDDFGNLIGYTILVVPEDMPTDFYVYRVASVSTYACGGSLVLNLDAASKYMKWPVRELEYRFGEASHKRWPVEGWHTQFGDES